MHHVIVVIDDLNIGYQPRWVCSPDLAPLGVVVLV